GRTPSLWVSLCLLFIEHWSQVYPIHVDPSRILFSLILSSSQRMFPFASLEQPTILCVLNRSIYCVPTHLRDCSVLHTSNNH
ncbi:Uncharacterized protein APZ42_032209, partial [Daphnia magna]